jgi:hypothetical protein
MCMQQNVSKFAYASSRKPSCNIKNHGNYLMLEHRLQLSSLAGRYLACRRLGGARTSESRLIPTQHLISISGWALPGGYHRLFLETSRRSIRAGTAVCTWIRGAPREGGQGRMPLRWRIVVEQGWNEAMDVRVCCRWWVGCIPGYMGACRVQCMGGNCPHSIFIFFVTC